MTRVTALRQESGSALIAGIIVLMVVMMLGFVAIQYADVQSHQTAGERAGEAAFNLASSAIQAENTALWQAWPATAAAAYPVCTQASTTSSTCPNSAITSGFSATYAGKVYASPTWSVQVIDNDATGVADGDYYSDSILTSSRLAHYDSNGDNKLWLRASATIGGQTRTVVALTSRQTFVVDLPQNVLTSGGVTTGNNGNKIIIEAKDSNSGLTGTVDVRCNSSTGAPAWRDPCAGWDPTHGQLDPAGAYQLNYVDPIMPFQSLSDGEIEALRQSAQYGGTYYPAGQCPPEYTSGVLFVENANCSYSGQGTTWGSDAFPDAIVVYNGTLTLTGLTFYGVIYMVNAQGTVPTSGECTADQQNSVITVGGSGTINGGLFIDKCGTASVGDASQGKGFNLSYDAKVFNGFRTYSNPAVALSTFRVLGNNGS
jgi:Tfp pilus assembly protein PilX